MKKIILLLAILATNIVCFAQESRRPFASKYNDGPLGYSLSSAVGVVSDISNGTAKIEAYTLLLQNLIDQYGIPVAKINFKNTKYILENGIEVVNESWSNGEILVGSLIEGGSTVSYFNRPSYSDRINKIIGDEPVGVLDVTGKLGWKDRNGNPIPKKIIMLMRCVNVALDLRSVPATNVVANVGSDAPNYNNNGNNNQNNSNQYNQTQSPQQVQTQCTCNNGNGICVIHKNPHWNGYRIESEGVYYDNGYSGPVWVGGPSNCNNGNGGAIIIQGSIGVNSQYGINGYNVYPNGYGVSPGGSVIVQGSVSANSQYTMNGYSNCGNGYGNSPSGYQNHPPVVHHDGGNIHVGRR